MIVRVDLADTIRGAVGSTLAGHLFRILSDQIRRAAALNAVAILGDFVPTGVTGLAATVRVGGRRVIDHGVIVHPVEGAAVIGRITAFAIAKGSARGAAVFPTSYIIRHVVRIHTAGIIEYEVDVGQYRDGCGLGKRDVGEERTDFDWCIDDWYGKGRCV